MKERVRCVSCDARRVLPKERRLYILLPRCRRCGNRTYYRVPPRKGVTCNCGGYEFKHRKGSKYCYEHPDAEALHTERSN